MRGEIIMQDEIEPPSDYSFLDILFYFTVLFLQIRLVHNIRSGKPRGFAFVEYEHECDMHCKYTSPKRTHNKYTTAKRMLN